MIAVGKVSLKDKTRKWWSPWPSQCLWKIVSTLWQAVSSFRWHILTVTVTEQKSDKAVLKGTCVVVCNPQKKEPSESK